jgi:GrpB-like predicted nucleotidyltransferase (UPF0157 family)
VAFQPKSRSRKPQTEEEIQAVSVGERKRLDGTVQLAPYDPQWPAIYSRAAQRIRDVLGGQVISLEHVGSTSVPGLSAKPIIDMVLTVNDSSAEELYVTPLEEHSYVLIVREADWYEHRMLKLPSKDGNLHVFSSGCEEVDRMLSFRDRLRRDDADRRLYEKRKHKLAAREWKYVQNYADAKSEIVETILSRAGGSLSKGPGTPG